MTILPLLTSGSMSLCPSLPPRTSVAAAMGNPQVSCSPRRCCGCISLARAPVAHHATGAPRRTTRQWQAMKSKATPSRYLH
uniref:Uncharacterized protein n=1 Tax=Arundo donax TaxID=35708 RepID=A0A0A8Y6G6_ARUDO